MNKAQEIKRLIHEGKTTREIAHELRVSLRDIGNVRKQMGVDLGILDRRKAKLESDLARLTEDRDQVSAEIATLRAIVIRLQNEIRQLEHYKSDLNDTIRRKKAEVVDVQQPINPIYVPVNKTEIESYLRTLSDEQMLFLQKAMNVVHVERQKKGYEEGTAKMLKKELERMGLSSE